MQGTIKSLHPCLLYSYVLNNYLITNSLRSVLGGVSAYPKSADTMGVIPFPNVNLVKGGAVKPRYLGGLLSVLAHIHLLGHQREIGNALVGYLGGGNSADNSFEFYFVDKFHIFTWFH